MFAVYTLTGVLSLTALFDNDAFATVIKALKYLSCLGAMIKIFLDRFNWKKLVSVFILGIILVLVVLSAGNTIYIPYLVMLIAAKDVNYTKVVKIICWIQGLCLLVVVSLSQLGIIEDYIFDPNDRIRHGLGFLWTTTAPILFFFFIMAYMYLRKNRVHIIECLVCEIIAYWLYVQTNTRMCFMLTTLFLVCVYIMKLCGAGDKREKQQKGFWSKLCIALPTVICAISLYIHIFYNYENALMLKLNNVISGRLDLGKNAFKQFGMSLFGQEVQWVGFGYNASAGTYNYVDCSFLQILIQYGIVVLVLIVALYTFLMYMAVKTKDAYFVAILIFILGLSITEPRLFDFNFNLFPILAASFFALGNRECLYQPEMTVKIRLDIPKLRFRNRY